MSNSRYLVEDHPMKAILTFSVPIMLGNLFQQLYIMTDSVIVGRFVGENALAAVGASYSLTSVFISVAIGGGMGASVITSRAFGSADYSKMKRCISTSLVAFLIISIVLGIFGLIFSQLILEALNTPENISGDASAYLRIYFAGLPFLFMYNILSSIFNALGKSRIPLYLLIFSSILNILLDVIAVTALDMGVSGAAWATLIAQAVSAAISFHLLLRTLRRIDGKISRMFSFQTLRSMSAIALPSILQQSVIAFGMMLVQGVVNGFGSEVLAGYSAAIRVDSIATVPTGAIGNALSSYTAQNIGARKEERIIKGYHLSYFLIIFFSALICLILQLFNEKIIGLFLGSDGSLEAYATGIAYLRYLSWFYPILGFAFITGGVLRGAGTMKLFTIASISNLTLRVLGAVLLASRYGASIIWEVVPAGWAVYFGICLYAYRKGNWKRALN